MPDTAPRRRSRAAAGLPPITADKIIGAAVEVTGEQGLDGLSIRQISTRLDVWPGAIAYHVGDREAVVMGVIDRVISWIPIPGDDIPWRDWFRSVMFDGRTVLRRYPGVARRLCAVGPNVPSALPTIDTGIRVLMKAGFGEHAPEVYRYLFNTAFTLVAVEDDRGQYPTARADMGRALAAFAEDESQPGLAAAGTTARARSTDPEAIAAQETEFFLFSLERSLDGAEALLTAG